MEMLIPKQFIEFVDKQDLEWIDIYFANFILESDEDKSMGIALASCLLSAAARSGHSYLDLKNYAGQVVFSDEKNEISAPTLNTWIDMLEKHRAIGNPDETKPMILDGNCLYLYRLWNIETAIANQVITRVLSPVPFVCSELDQLLDEFFPLLENENNDQRGAAKVAMSHYMSVIQGGPGTGKTTTMVKIILIYLRLCKNDHPVIRLVAPTGKAARRLSESIIDQVSSIDKEWQQTLIDVANNCTTVHKLLSSARSNRYAEPELLYTDLLIIDEASMLDIQLAASLLNILPDTALCIISGDANQLASVEPGALFADLCAFAAYMKTNDNEQGRHNPSADEQQHQFAVSLRKNYRFSNDSGIFQLATMIKQADVDGAMLGFAGKQFENVHWHEIDALTSSSGQLFSLIDHGYSPYFSTLVEETDIGQQYQAFQSFQVLCAQNQGAYGVHEINQSIVRRFFSMTTRHHQLGYHHGDACMITKNDYQFDVSNGDVGIVMMKNGHPTLHLPSLENEYRSIPLSLLTHYDRAFAITIHKSQGSEYDHVLIILGNELSSVLSRELFYTAVTRAKKKVSIVASEEVLRNVLQRKTIRHTGLLKKLKLGVKSHSILS